MVKGQRAEDGSTAQLKMKKRNHTREVPVPEWLTEKRDKYLANHAELPTARYETSRSRLMYAAKVIDTTFTRASGESATHEDFTSQMLRHQFATTLLSRRVSPPRPGG